MAVYPADDSNSMTNMSVVRAVLAEMDYSSRRLNVFSANDGLQSIFFPDWQGNQVSTNEENNHRTVPSNVAAVPPH